MTWRLPEQDPCTEPCCTGGLKRPFDELGGVGSTDREIAPVREQRECTEEDPCRFCGPVQFWDRDPAPVEAPPEPASRYVWDDHYYNPPEAPIGFRHIGDLDIRDVPRVGIIRRILNATRRNT